MTAIKSETKGYLKIPEDPKLIKPTKKWLESYNKLAKDNSFCITKFNYNLDDNYVIYVDGNGRVGVDSDNLNLQLNMPKESAKELAAALGTQVLRFNFYDYVEIYPKELESMLKYEGIIKADGDKLQFTSTSVNPAKSVTPVKATDYLKVLHGFEKGYLADAGDLIIVETKLNKAGLTPKQIKAYLQYIEEDKYLDGGITERRLNKFIAYYKEDRRVIEVVTGMTLKQIEYVDTKTVKEKLELIYKSDISPDSKLTKIEEYLYENHAKLYAELDDIIGGCWIFDCDARINELSDIDDENRSVEDIANGGWHDQELEAMADKIQDYKEHGYDHIIYIHENEGTNMITTLVDRDIRFLIDDLSGAFHKYEK